MCGRQPFSDVMTEESPGFAVEPLTFVGSRATEGDVTDYKSKKYGTSFIVALRDVTESPVVDSNNADEIGIMADTTLMVGASETRRGVLAFAIEALTPGRGKALDTGLTLAQAKLLHEKIGNWIEAQQG